MSGDLTYCQNYGHILHYHPLSTDYHFPDRVGDPSVHDLNVERNDETILRFHGVEEDAIRTLLDDQRWRCNDEDICDNPEECQCILHGVKPEAAVSSAFGTGDRSNRRIKKSVVEVVLWVSAHAELGHRHRGGERHYARDSNGNARLPIGNLQDRQEGTDRGSREAGTVWQRTALPATEPTSLLAWQTNSLSAYHRVLGTTRSRSNRNALSHGATEGREMYGHAFHDQGRVHYQSPNPNTLNSTATEVDSSSGNDDGSLEDFHLPPLIRGGGGRSYARDEKCGHATHGESVENSRYVGDDLIAAKTGRWPPQHRIRGECGRRVRGASIFDIDEIDSGPDNLKVTAANGTAMAENHFAGIDGRDQENVAPGRAHAPESHSRAMTDGPRTNFRRRDQDRAAGSPRLLEAESDDAGAPVPSLYIPKPQTHFIAEDDVSAPSQPSTTSRDTDEDSLVDVIDTQTWGSESQSSTSTLRSSSPKDESGRAGPTAGPSDNHDGAAFRRLRRSYGAGTADRTNIATAPGGDVHRGILACERYAGTSRPDDGPVRDYVWSYSQTTSG